MIYIDWYSNIKWNCLPRITWFCQNVFYPFYIILYFMLIFYFRYLYLCLWCIQPCNFLFLFLYPYKCCNRVILTSWKELGNIYFLFSRRIYVISMLLLSQKFRKFTVETIIAWYFLAHLFLDLVSCAFLGIYPVNVSFQIYFHEIVTNIF